MGYLKNLKYDLPASIVVFLVALPLCLGIALASNAPLFSGILTGVIGGIIVGFLSGSSVSVSGPAAGLTVIVASGIQSLGGFEIFLAAVVLSGCFQLLFGALKGGFLASLFPNSVVKGMLSAIGITIILKQIPHALGNFGQFESDMAFWNIFESDSTWQSLVAALDSIKVGALLICSVSLGILWLWETPKLRTIPWLSRIPGPLVAVVFAASANWLFHFGFHDLALHADNGHLVLLPNITSLAAFTQELRFPDFSMILSANVWTVAITLAAVGSIETLLSIESTDKLDPFRRVSNTNRELFAQGIGNITAGFVGGIPMTSVIVRSSANIYAGSKSRLSGILHGVILLISVVALGPILNLIPVAALAAVLLAVGYKLAHPKLFKAAFRAGPDQYVPFLITIAAILFTDLLRGVTIGLLVGLGFVLKASYYSAILVVRHGSDVLLRFTKDVTFIHKVQLRKELGLIPPGSHVFFDATRASFIDRDVFEMIHEFSSSAAERGIHVEMKDITLRESTLLKQNLKENNHGILQKNAPSQ